MRAIRTRPNKPLRRPACVAAPLSPPPTPTAKLWQAMHAQDWAGAWRAAQEQAVDPNWGHRGGLTPFLWAAWAGQSLLLERLGALGGRAGDRFQDRGLAELALESRDEPTLAVALSVLPDAELAGAGWLEPKAVALGLGGRLSALLQQEGRRRLAKRLDRQLAGVAMERGQARL